VDEIVAASRIEMLKIARIALLCVLLLSLVAESEGRLFGLFSSKKRVKLPRNKKVDKAIKVKGVTVTRIGEDAASEDKPALISSLTSASSLAIRPLAKLFQPDSLVFHIAPPFLIMGLTRALSKIDFTSKNAISIIKVVVAVQALVSQLILWFLHRQIRRKADSSLFEWPAPTVYEAVLRTDTVRHNATTVMDYDIAQFEKLKSNILMETIMAVFLLSARFTILHEKRN
jgi:hypothetical protein